MCSACSLLTWWLIDSTGFFLWRFLYHEQSACGGLCMQSWRVNTVFKTKATSETLQAGVRLTLEWSRLSAAPATTGTKWRCTAAWVRVFSVRGRGRETTVLLRSTQHTHIQISSLKSVMLLMSCFLTSNDYFWQSRNDWNSVSRSSSGCMLNNKMPCLLVMCDFQLTSCTTLHQGSSIEFNENLKTEKGAFSVTATHNAERETEKTDRCVHPLDDRLLCCPAHA